MEHKINVKGIEINYRQGGQGSPMILMHGWGSDHSTLALFERVGREQHEVYNIDLPGFGKSEEPPTAWGVEEYTEMLEEFVRKLNIERPILLGHSFGGRVAILFSSRNEIERLILVDAAGIKPRHSLKYYLKVYPYKFAKNVYPLILGRKKADKIIERMRSKSGSIDYRNSSPMMRQVMVKVVNEDLRRHLSSITAPALLLWGENDTATPMRDAHLMNRLLKNSTLVSFPGAGHYSFLDNPFQSAAVVRRFIHNDNAENDSHEID